MALNRRRQRNELKFIVDFEVTKKLHTDTFISKEFYFIWLSL